jgi:hypothetical protein
VKGVVGTVDRIIRSEGCCGNCGHNYKGLKGVV